MEVLPPFWTWQCHVVARRPIRHFSPVKCLAANNILRMRKANRAFLLLAIVLAWKWQIASLPEDIHLKNKLGDRMIKQLLNSVIAKYRDLSVSHRSIICLSRRLWLLAKDKSRYFAQPRPIIANYLPKPKADANNWSARQWQITISCDNRVQ